MKHINKSHSIIKGIQQGVNRLQLRQDSQDIINLLDRLEGKDKLTGLPKKNKMSDKNIKLRKKAMR